MQTHINKNQEKQSNSKTTQLQQKAPATFQFADHRPEALQLKQLQSMANNSPQSQQLVQLQQMANAFTAKNQAPIQKQANKTGLPDSLKSGIENLSGYSMDDVKVHYNSNKPAQLDAQGSDIHVASGQEKHLPHEAWHVVQQKQGRVKPTLQLKGNVTINDDTGLEKEADVMGGKAIQFSQDTTVSQVKSYDSVGDIGVVQMALPTSLEVWTAANQNSIQAVEQDNDSQNIYTKLHYIEHVIKPSLTPRFDYIKKHLGDDKVKEFKQKLMISYGLMKHLEDSNKPNRFTLADDLYKSNNLDKFITNASKEIDSIGVPTSWSEWKVNDAANLQTVSHNNDQQNIYVKYHYIEHIVKPFLGARFDYIKNYLGDDKLKEFKQKLMVSYGIMKHLEDSNDPKRFTWAQNLYESNKLNQFIIDANKLPTTMEKISHKLGGYEEDREFGSTMHSLGKTLNNIARDTFNGGDGSKALPPSPATVPGKNTKDVPVMSAKQFLSHKDIPESLKRLVSDIHLHWKSKKVMDTRTTKQQNEKAKTPDQTGALRTYHMNEHATIPRLPSPYTGDHPLHDHYAKNSQGSSVHGGDPYGFAEYTGIDSDQNKIVLDYVNGQVYVTCTHYKHWFDNQDNPKTHSGDIATSREQINAQNREQDLQSPWVKVKF